MSDTQNNPFETAPVVATTTATKTRAVNENEVKHTILLQCAIRRRPNLVGLPGTDPNERNYKIGAAIDRRTRKNLKGVDGILEQKFMPGIIGINATDNNFQDKVNEYWGNIGVLVPADETFLKEEEKGLVLKAVFTVAGLALKQKLEEEKDIAKKVEMLCDGLIKGVITIDYSSIPDFILLCYTLKYNRVAKDVSLLGMSPKILFYVYNKAIAVKAQLSLIDLRSKAISAFNAVMNDEKQLNYLLVMFDLLPDNYRDINDKLIALDTAYNKSTADMTKFVHLADDKNLNLKYLITYAIKKGKLNKPVNTESIYYNQELIGKDLDDAVRYLKQDNPDSRKIKETLIREIKD